MSEGNRRGKVPLGMRKMMRDLLLLQNIESHGAIGSAEGAKELELLRTKVPGSILEIFDRWLGRGKKAVAVVRGGVCSECHLKVAIGVLAQLAAGDQLARCGNCGRLLYLPVEESSSAAEQLPASRHRTTEPKRSLKAQQSRGCRQNGPPRRAELTSKRAPRSRETPERS